MQDRYYINVEPDFLIFAYSYRQALLIYLKINNLKTTPASYEVFHKGGNIKRAFEVDNQGKIVQKEV